MTYRLSKLAAGSYDVILEGVIIASLVRNQKRHHVTWTAELLTDLPPEHMPPPFTESEHEFATWEEACRWLSVSVEYVVIPSQAMLAGSNRATVFARGFRSRPEHLAR